MTSNRDASAEFRWPHAVMPSTLRRESKRFGPKVEVMAIKRVHSDRNRHEPRLRRRPVGRQRGQRGDQADRRRARRRCCRPAVDRQRLHDHVRLVHPVGRGFRRPSRRAAGVRRRLRGVHGGLRALRPGAVARDPDRGPGRAGTGSGGAGPVLTDPAQPHLPGAARARAGGWDVGSRRVDRPVRRPGRRRRADRDARMASDLLHQRPDRADRDLADAPLCERDTTGARSQR